MPHLKRRRRDRKMTCPTPGVDSNPFQSAIKLIGFSIPFLKNVEIYAESEPADYVYKVIGGAVRCYKILNDGRRQINAFYLPGDIFGLEIGGVHAFSAEAVVDSKILLIKRSSLIDIAARDNRVARELWTLTAAELQRMQQHAVVFIMSAQERVVSFLVEIAKRGATASAVELPTILGSQLRLFVGRLNNWRNLRQSNCLPSTTSCYANAPHLAESLAKPGLFPNR